MHFFYRESVEGHYVPNAGFLEDVVFEDPAFLQLCTSESCEGASEASNSQQNGSGSHEVGEPVDVTNSLSESNQASSSLTQFDVENVTAEEIIAGVGDLTIKENVPSEELSGHHTLSTEDVDALLDKCLLQALHTTVKDKDLPLPGSTLWYEECVLLKL